MNTKILVAGGDVEGREDSTAVFIVDLDGDGGNSDSCDTLPDLPEPMRQAEGALVNRVPIICSGLASNKCYIYSSVSKSWEMSDFTPENRLYGASSLVVNDEEWWIAGGYSLGFEDRSVIFKVNRHNHL